MRDHIRFIVIIIALLLNGCLNNPDKGNVKGRNPDDQYSQQIIRLPATGGDTLKASLFADTVIYTPLETTEESFIQRIDQLWTKTFL
jgi:PBP1b-binding outer membrane lipoprotein LpoB